MSFSNVGEMLASTWLLRLYRLLWLDISLNLPGVEPLLAVHPGRR
jgi:hypothetical protein